MRPTSEVVRDRWLTLVEADLKGAFVLDLFAGTGALGLEALSRGASKADFVEFGEASLHSLKANVAALRVRSRTRIFKRDAIPFVESLQPFAYDIAFADPPYGSAKLDRVVGQWLEIPFSRTLTFEHDRSHRLDVPGKRYDMPGNTRITILHATPDPIGRVPPQGTEDV
ncbi:MAG: RsmD family RNA methyltransferase [Gemmatimonadota bacterium]